MRYSGSLGRRIGREISVAPIVNELHESVEVLSEDPNFGTIICQSELFLTKMHRSVGYDRSIGFRKISKAGTRLPCGAAARPNENTTIHPSWVGLSSLSGQPIGIEFIPWAIFSNAPSLRQRQDSLTQIQAGGNLMKVLQSLRKMVARGIVLAAFAVCACAAVRADDVVQTVTLTPSGSDNNVTNSDVINVFSDAVDFNKFNSALGTLTSATLSWTGTGSLTVDGNMEGQAIMSFQSSSDTESWNIFGSSATENFSISSGGDEVLSLTGLTGSGTVDEGSFAETFQEQEGYFPASFTSGPTTGTFTLTYDYTPPGAPPPPPPAVPELPSFAYLFTALLLVTPGLHRLAKKNS